MALVRPHSGFVLYQNGVRIVLKREDILDDDHPWVKSHRGEFEPVAPTYNKAGEYFPGAHRARNVEEATDNPGEGRRVRIPSEER